MRRKVFSFTVLLLVITACTWARQPITGVSTPASGKATDSGSQPSSMPSEVSIVTSPAATSTATPSQPVYDPAQLGDLSQLDSYVVTNSFRLQKGSQPGAPEGQRATNTTLTVINHPFHAAYTSVNTWVRIANSEDVTRTLDYYWIGDLVYEHSTEGRFWDIQKPNDKNNEYMFTSLSDTLAWFKPVYAGEQDYHGIPAYHFVINETIKAPASQDSPERETSFTGNVFLAKEGNYPLHLDFQQSGNMLWWENDPNSPDKSIYFSGSGEEVYEVTSINQVKEIQIPTDVPKQVNLAIGVPLPPEAEFDHVMIMENNSNRFMYTYSVNLTDDQILDFYRNYQPPADGWSVNTAAKDPDGSGGVIALKKGDKMVILTINYNQYANANQISFQYTAP